MTQSLQPDAFVPDSSEPSEPQIPRYSAQDLTRGGSTAAIELNGQLYTLRITRQAKLILTK